MTTITKLLIANRGEIASRIIRTARDDGHRDRRGVLRRRRATRRSCARPTRRSACPAPRPPTPTCAATWSSRRPAGPAPTPSTPATASSRRTRDFARACAEAGIIFVGPARRGDRGDGLQDRGQGHDGAPPASRCCPASPSKRADEDRRRACRRPPPRSAIPVLVKAAFGGGGRGMRIVRDRRRA